MQLSGRGQLTAESYLFSSLTLFAWDYSMQNREAALAQSVGIAISFRVRPASDIYYVFTAEIKRETKQFYFRPLHVKRNSNN